MKIYEHAFDNPCNEDGTKKENKLLGNFEIVDGLMDDYSYRVIIKDKDEKLFVLNGTEVSGFYNPKMGGTKNRIEPLEDNYFVKIYKKFNKQTFK